MLKTFAKHIKSLPQNKMSAAGLQEKSFCMKISQR